MHDHGQENSGGLVQRELAVGNLRIEKHAVAFTQIDRLTSENDADASGKDEIEFLAAMLHQADTVIPGRIEGHQQRLEEAILKIESEALEAVSRETFYLRPFPVAYDAIPMQVGRFPGHEVGHVHAENPRDAIEDADRHVQQARFIVRILRKAEAEALGGLGCGSPSGLSQFPDSARNFNAVAVFLNHNYLLIHVRHRNPISFSAPKKPEYRRLLFDCGYAGNVRHAKSYAPAWRTHIDDELLTMAYPALLLYETDPALRALYRESLDHWYKSLRSEWNPLANFTYGLLTGENPQCDDSAGFLRDAPLDLVCWTVDNTRREDIQLVRAPIWDLLQTNRLLPASERAVVRWDKNPWMAVQGEDGHCEWCPVFWLLPYWMGRYAGFIQVKDEG